MQSNRRTPGGLVLQAGDAIVRVNACAITPTELSWNATYTHRYGTDRRPSIPGHELSGVVVKVAADLTDSGFIGRGKLHRPLENQRLRNHSRFALPCVQLLINPKSTDHESDGPPQ